MGISDDFERDQEQSERVGGSGDPDPSGGREGVSGGPGGPGDPPSAPEDRPDTAPDPDPDPPPNNNEPVPPRTPASPRPQFPAVPDPEPTTLSIDVPTVEPVLTTFSVPVIDFEFTAVTGLSVGTRTETLTVPTEIDSIQRGLAQRVEQTIAGLEQSVSELRSEIGSVKSQLQGEIEAAVDRAVETATEAATETIGDVRSDLLGLIADARQRAVQIAERLVTQAERRLSRLVDRAFGLIGELRSDLDRAISQTLSDVRERLDSLRSRLVPAALSQSVLERVVGAVIARSVPQPFGSLSEALSFVATLRRSEGLRSFIADPPGFVLDGVLSEAKRRFGSGLAVRIKALVEAGLQAVLSDTAKQRLKARRGDG